jgi:hypothetical protein
MTYPALYCNSFASASGEMEVGTRHMAAKLQEKLTMAAP